MAGMAFCSMNIGKAVVLGVKLFEAAKAAGLV